MPHAENPETRCPTRRKFLADVPVDSTGAIAGPVFSKLSVLLRVAGTRIMPAVPHFEELAATTVAACCALCAFTSSNRSEVLEAVAVLCKMEDSVERVVERPGLLQRAEQMLPGACAALMLTIAEAHLVNFEAELQKPEAREQGLLAADCAILSSEGVGPGSLRVILSVESCSLCYQQRLHIPLPWQTAACMR